MAFTKITVSIYFRLNDYYFMNKLCFGLVWFAAFLFFFSSCELSDGKKNVRAYYFPLKSLEEGLVYEYESVSNDSLQPVYWYYRSLYKKEGVYLTGTYYGNYPGLGLVPMQFVREEMISNGMLLADLYLYETDSSGKQQQVPVEKIVDTAFPFEVSEDSGIFLYKIKWTPLSDTLSSITLIKNRRYLRDTSINFKGKNHPAILVEVKELLEHNHQEDGHFEQQFNGIEVYAKNIGLFYYKKNISKGFTLEYQLKERYPMEQLEAEIKGEERMGEKGE